MSDNQTKLPSVSDNDETPINPNEVLAAIVTQEEFDGMEADLGNALWVKYAYLVEEYSEQDIADETGGTRTEVRNRLVELGVELRNQKEASTTTRAIEKKKRNRLTAEDRERADKILGNREYLYREYVLNRRTMVEIAKMTRSTKARVEHWIDYFSLKDLRKKISNREDDNGVLSYRNLLNNEPRPYDFGDCALALVTIDNMADLPIQESVAFKCCRTDYTKGKAKHLYYDTDGNLRSGNETKGAVAMTTSLYVAYKFYHEKIMGCEIPIDARIPPQKRNPSSEELIEIKRQMGIKAQLPEVPSDGASLAELTSRVSDQVLSNQQKAPLIDYIRSMVEMRLRDIEKDPGLYWRGGGIQVSVDGQVPQETIDRLIDEFVRLDFSAGDGFVIARFKNP